MQVARKKESLYTTARAALACAAFKVGDVVAIRWSHQNANGVHWYDVLGSQHGMFDTPIAYPEHHMTDFVL